MREGARAGVCLGDFHHTVGHCSRGVHTYRGAMSLRLAGGQFRGELLYGLRIAAQFVVGLICLRHLGDQGLYLTEHECAATSNINK